MALVSLYDPYEWFDPERGRQGVLVHTSQFDSIRPGRRTPVETPETAWRRVWETQKREPV